MILGTHSVVKTFWKVHGLNWLVDFENMPTTINHTAAQCILHVCYRQNVHTCPIPMHVLPARLISMSHNKNETQSKCFRPMPKGPTYSKHIIAYCFADSLKAYQKTSHIFPADSWAISHGYCGK